MRRALLALPLLAACLPVTDPGPSFWAGDWTTDPATCANRALIGESDLAPIRLTATSLTGLENSCRIDSVAGPDGEGRTTLALTCSAEGMTFPDTLLVRLLAGDRLEMTRPGLGSTIYTRCP